MLSPLRIAKRPAARRAVLGLVAVALLATGGCCDRNDLNTAPGDIQWSPLSLALTADAGTQVKGSITLTNQGANAIDVLSAAFEGDAGSILTVTGATSFTVGAGGQAQVTVVYAPVAPGSSSAELQIQTDASNAPTVSIPVQGTCPGATTATTGTTGGSTSGGGTSGGSTSGGSASSGGSTSGGSTSGGSTSGGSSSGGSTSGGSSSGGYDGGILTVLGTSMSPNYLAVDSQNVYWDDDNAGAVYQAPLSGSGPTVTLSSTSVNPAGIAVQGGDIYWVDNGDFTVNAVAIGSSSPRVLATSLNNLQVAVNASTVYWTTAEGTVEELPIDGGTPAPFATSYGYGIALDSQNLYWAVQDVSAAHNTPAIQKAPLSGSGPVVTLATGLGSPALLTIDANNAYWIDSANKTVNQVSLDGGTPLVLASGYPEPWGIAVDSTSVYFDDETLGEVYAVPIGGGNVSTLATGQSYPYGMAVDATSLYWANQGGQVVKLTPK